MAYDFKIRSEVNTKGKTSYYAKITGSADPEFFVAYKTKYQERFGLYNSSVSTNLVYKASDYVGEFGFWAYFIEATAKVESEGSFLCLNTYDRAFFTFGFMQFATHVPNGDFVRFFRKLLTLPNALDYFPRLRLTSGRIFYKSDAGTTSQLENDTSTVKLMEYLNPTTNEVEQQELICSARFVHWASNDEEHRRIQVEHSISLYKENMRRYSKRLNLNGYPAKVCFMVCDILHQGRGTYDRISYALDTKDHEEAFENLCTIGNNHYQSRIDGVKAHVKRLEQSGIFNKTYHADTNEFM
ncbi:hypothetical protein GCM10023210_13190 [Chryseobacterium ginsengisoli]|uniref:Uncharacterized protein n=1 Tax=Chryseobacterium ginsengisoli TaxID=363853 RepID=A0ABP9M005_9FLAO